MSNLKVNFCGIDFKNPIVPASGTFGFGREFDELYDISKLGGISCKGTTILKKDGNPPPRIAETSSGIINSVGLQNPGIDHFLKFDLPFLKKKDIVVILNVAGAKLEDYLAVIEKVNDSAVDMVELNISCPNVKEGGVAFGTSCASAASITKAVKNICKKPLMVKLSPNVSNIGEIAKAVESEGADAVSLINTLTGMRIDIDTRRPILRNNTGGLSGPAVFPVAVRMVNEVYRSVNIPIMGMGGITSWQDAVEMMMAGASALQVGTAIFTHPKAPLEIIDGLGEYLYKNNIKNISELTGTVELW